MRTRLPTCLSIGFGVFLAIIIMRSSITPVYGVMAVDSNSVTIDSNSYAIHIPMVRHQVMRKCDKLPFLRAVSQWPSRVGCVGDSADAAHNVNLWGFERSRPSFIPQCRTGSGGARRETARWRQGQRPEHRRHGHRAARGLVAATANRSRLRGPAAMN